LIPKSVFDNAIFERMETDDHRVSAGLHPVDQRPGQKLLKVFEFVIDGNPQSLKDSRRRVNFVTSFWPARQGLRNGRDEIGGGPIGNLSPPCDDRPGDRSTGALFSVSLKQVSQLGFAERRKKFRGGCSRGGIKSHVEQAAALKATLNPEPARGVGQLVGRQAEIEQDAVDSADSERIEDLRHFGIAGVFQNRAGIVEFPRGPREHLRIAVEADQFPVGSQLFED
jgi:hypothetical protein